MKKAEFYINVESKDVAGYPKVSGYIEEVTDSEGNVLTIGYDQRGSWIATELITGFACSVGKFKTKAECAEWVHNNIDIIANAKYRKLHFDRLGAISLQRFRDFVNNQF